MFQQIVWHSADAQTTAQIQVLERNNRRERTMRHWLLAAMVGVIFVVGLLIAVRVEISKLPYLSAHDGTPATPGDIWRQQIPAILPVGLLLLGHAAWGYFKNKRSTFLIENKLLYVCRATCTNVARTRKYRYRYHQVFSVRCENGYQIEGLSSDEYVTPDICVHDTCMLVTTNCDDTAYPEFVYIANGLDVNLPS